MTTIRQQGNYILGIKFLVCAILALAALFASFSGVASAQNPVPLLNQPLVPDAKAPGATGFTLTVNGTGFVPGSVVKWNGSTRTTTFVSNSQLKANILASDITKARTASVTVFSPTPGGGISNEVVFAAARPISFVSLKAASFAVGSGLLSSLAIGDFNRDGKADLAVTDANGSTVSILLGNGNGTFRPPVNYATGNASSVATGDFNADGKQDLAVANGEGSVSILLGNGDGTFHPAVDYPAGSNLQTVVVGDFNADGKLDLAVTNYADGDVMVLLGNGDGTFQAAASYSTGSGSGPIGVATGDFNGDGKLDLVVVGFACGACGSISVLLGNGNGTFQTPVYYNGGSEPVAVAVGDFNHDGKLDLAVADISSSHIKILLGKGDGTFQAPVSYSTGGSPVSVVLGDINGDGNLDVAVENISSSNVSLLLGNGNGTFQPALSYTFGSSSDSNATGAIGIGDFDRDGGLDLAVAAPGSATVSVMRQGPSASLSETNLQFAAQIVGTSSMAQQVTLTSSGYLTLSITSISIIGADAIDFSETNTCPMSLPVGATCTISITFRPSRIGPRTASVMIINNAPGSPQSIALTGVGETDHS